MRLKGDIKDVTLALKAMAAFYKTVEAYEAATAKFTPEQKARHTKLMVAVYKQIYLDPKIPIAQFAADYGVTKDTSDGRYLELIDEVEYEYGRKDRS